MRLIYPFALFHFYFNYNLATASFVQTSDFQVLNLASSAKTSKGRPFKNNKRTATFESTLLSSSTHSNQFNSILTLFATGNIPGQRPPPRRNLKKRPIRQNGKNRRNRRNIIQDNNEKDDFPWDTAEVRPLVQSRSKEAGLDYWMDEEELARSLEYEKSIKNRKALETEISQEKLRSEVVAPYKQNWIGLFSVSIIVLAVIIQQFPDLLDSPLIPIPDL